MAADDLVEWIDGDGRVIELVSRHRMRAEQLRHRCSYVVLIASPALPGGPTRLASNSEVVVHRRADWKDVFGGYWDLAFGGVCEPGESWGDAARRELAEEAGIALAEGGEMEDLGPVTYSGEVSVLGRLFLAGSSVQPRSTDGEVVAFERIRLDRVEDWATTHTVCPDTLHAVLPRLVSRLEET